MSNFTGSGAFSQIDQPVPRGSGAETKMANHPNRSRKFYAAQSPRGFANEINIHAFQSRQERDAWVAEHEDVGDVNSAACGARAITSGQARKIRCDRGDAATQTYNSVICH